MKINTACTVFNAERIEKNSSITLLGGKNTTIMGGRFIAYPPLINIHDHLVGNWYPKAGKGPYINSHIWVKDMVNSESVLERNKIWKKTGNDFDLLGENAQLLVSLGVYKNIFSGVCMILDHMPNQPSKYYQNQPIPIIEKYRQLHSITLGNWWGGLTAEQELALANGTMPFVLHLAEGFDENTLQEFDIFEKKGLLKHNTVIVHGAGLTTKQLQKIAKAKASIAWCPSSNDFLLGKTIDIETALAENINVCLGTDSTLSGSSNMFAELKYAAAKVNSSFELFDMVTKNPAKAINNGYTGTLENQTKNILLLNKHFEDPFENLINCQMHDVALMVYNSKPIYGNFEFLENFEILPENYTIFATKGIKKFVIGKPFKILKTINKKLGYKKQLPYIPIHD